MVLTTAPGWFDKIWSIMKNMLAADFRKKVHMIRESQLPEFLADGYSQYLPDDMATGTVPTQTLVEDFVSYRKAVEVQA
jgi:hypothetical protein